MGPGQFPPGNQSSSCQQCRCDPGSLPEVYPKSVLERNRGAREADREHPQFDAGMGKAGPEAARGSSAVGVRDAGFVYELPAHSVLLLSADAGCDGKHSAARAGERPASDTADDRYC